MCILCVTLALHLLGCASNRVSTGLLDDAQHTGTVTILRVDDLWQGIKDEEHSRYHYRIGDGYDERAPRLVPAPPQV